MSRSSDLYGDNNGQTDRLLYPCTCHEINSYEINSHEINSRESILTKLTSHKINSHQLQGPVPWACRCVDSNDPTLCRKWQQQPFVHHHLFTQLGQQCSKKLYRSYRSTALSTSTVHGSVGSSSSNSGTISTLMADAHVEGQHSCLKKQCESHTPTSSSLSK